MLWTLAFVLIALWTLVLVGGYDTSALIHLLPIFAVMAVVIRVLAKRRLARV